MNSLCPTSLKNSPIKHMQIQLDQNSVSIDLSQSYRDILFNHIMEVESLSSDKENITSANKQTKRKNNFRKVAQDMILSQISPNLGSLEQFLIQKSKIVQFTQIESTNTLKQRKRNQQLNEQNGLKKLIAQKKIQENLILSNDSSNYEKKLASQVFVQRIFDKVYHASVEEFISSNTKKEVKKEKLLSMQTLQSLLLNDLQSQKNKSTKRFKTEQSDSSLLLSPDKKKDKVFPLSFDFEIKVHLINQLKSKYYGKFCINEDLRKIQIPKQHHEFNILIEAQNQLEKHLRQLSQSALFSQRSSLILNSARNSLIDRSIMLTELFDIEKKMEQVAQNFKKSHLKSVIYPDTIAKFTQEEIMFKKMEFRDLEMGLYMISCVKLYKIKVIRFQNIKIEPNLLFMFLDVLCKSASHINPLKQLSISSISLESTFSILLKDINLFSEKIAQLLKVLKVTKLCLNYTDMGSQQFAKICVGMSENEFLTEVQMRNNQIDFLAMKPLETFLRIARNLKSIDLRGNEIANHYNLKSKDERIIV